MNRKYLLTFRAAFEASAEKRATLEGSVFCVGPEVPTEMFLKQQVEKWVFKFNKQKLVPNILGPGDVTILVVVPLELVVDKDSERQ